MILSKSALQAAAIVAATDKPETVYLKDGACYAVNRKASIMLSPIAAETLRAVPLQDSGPCSIAVSAEALRQVIKMIPKDSLFKGLLEHTDVKPSEDGSTLDWAVSDGRRNHSMKCASEPFDLELVSNLRNAWMLRWNTSSPARFSALNLKRLSLLLEASQAAGCSLSGEEPCWMRFCSDGTVLSRSVNFATHIRALGMCTAYDAEEGQAVDFSEWEKQIKAPTAVYRTPLKRGQ